MTSTTTPTTRTTGPLNQTHLTTKDRTMSPDPRHPIRTALAATAAFLGLLLLVALWTVYGPTYDAQALTPATTATATEPCPAGEATGGTCGTEGQVAGPAAPSTSPSDSPQTGSPAPSTTQRRCKGCRLSQEEYDARQADKQAAHDRAEARRQRGADRRAEAQRKREERSARKSSKPSSPAKSSSSHADKASESPSNGLPAQDGTSTLDDASSSSQDAPEASTDTTTSDNTAASDDPGTPAPYTPLEIPESSRKTAPYDASKDPFEVRREAARQAADAVNHTHTSDQVKAPSTAPSATSTPAPTGSSGYWAEQMPTWALGLIGFLAASGLLVYKASRPRGDRRS